MNQLEAIEYLSKLLDRPIHPDDSILCSGDANTCAVEECMICSVRDCPDNEPLHYHHDGCPACYQREKNL